jgi:hypothetical protein
MQRRRRGRGQRKGERERRRRGKEKREERKGGEGERRKWFEHNHVDCLLKKKIPEPRAVALIPAIWELQV